MAASRAGGDAALLGGVGDDDWGRWLRRRLEADGVHTGWLAAVENTNTPLALVTLDGDREARFQVYGEGIQPTMLAGARFLEEAMDEASALVFGSNTLVEQPEREVTMRARRAALDRGLPVLFDPNLRPNRWEKIDRAGPASCRELCDGAHLVHANLEEAALLTSEKDPDAAADGLALWGRGSASSRWGPRAQ